MRVEQTVYGNSKEILKYPDHYVAVPVMLDDTGIVADSNGRKIVKAGTILAGKVGKLLGQTPGTTELAVKATTTAQVSNAEGVLFKDVDVTKGPKNGAMLIHAFVDLEKIPVAPDAYEIAALKQITFIKQ